MATTRSTQTSTHCPTCDRRGIRDVSDVSRRQAASVNVPAKLASVNSMQMLTARAESLARTLLADTLPRRWSHVQGVAARARTLKPSLGADADLIEAAAWLHDIGYLSELAQTGLHGLDGARYLRDIQHAEPLLCRLVAHHSCAVIEAEERGLAHVLTREFAPPPQPPRHPAHPGGRRPSQRPSRQHQVNNSAEIRRSPSLQVMVNAQPHGTIHGIPA